MKIAHDLILKAIDDLEAARILMPTISQHDNAGAHLCKAAEKFGKAFLEINGIQNYPKTGKDGHDLQMIWRMLSQTDFPVERYKILLKLQIYDSRVGYHYIDEEAQLNLKALFSLVSEMKAEVLRALKKTKSRR